MVLTGVPNGILFKSASTRGDDREYTYLGCDYGRRADTCEHHNELDPAYSYATLPKDVLPAGMKVMPDYWKTLLAPVPPEKVFRIFRISGFRT